jgi:uncharacterized protein YcsI (UPF0317 family)
MKIKLRYGHRDLRSVDVSRRDCPMLDCFQPGHYTHHTSAGASGCGSRTDKHLSCVWRDGRGCPLKRKQRIAAPPRYRLRCGVWEEIRNAP